MSPLPAWTPSADDSSGNLSTNFPGKAQRLVDRGEAQAVLRFNHGFAAALRAGSPALVQMFVDGSDSNTAGIILNYASKIIGRFSNKTLLTRMNRLGGGQSAGTPLVIESRAWFNANLESRNFYVPGVIAILVMLITLMLTSMAVVREKEVGTMEQIMVTPITPGEFILGKTTPFALIGLADVLLITVVAVFWSIRGSFLLLFLATGLYIMTTLGIGLLISTMSSTQQQAMMSTLAAATDIYAVAEQNLARTEAHLDLVHRRKEAGAVAAADCGRKLKSPKHSLP